MAYQLVIACGLRQSAQVQDIIDRISGYGGAPSDLPTPDSRWKFAADEITDLIILWADSPYWDSAPYPSQDDLTSRIRDVIRRTMPAEDHEVLFDAQREALELETAGERRSRSDDYRMELEFAAATAAAWLDLIPVLSPGTYRRRLRRYAQMLEATGPAEPGEERSIVARWLGHLLQSIGWVVFPVLAGSILYFLPQHFDITWHRGPFHLLFSVQEQRAFDVSGHYIAIVGIGIVGWLLRIAGRCLLSPRITSQKLSIWPLVLFDVRQGGITALLWLSEWVPINVFLWIHHQWRPIWIQDPVTWLFAFIWLTAVFMILKGAADLLSAISFGRPINHDLTVLAPGISFTSNGPEGWKLEVVGLLSCYEKHSLTGDRWKYRLFGGLIRNEGYSGWEDGIPGDD